MYYWKMAESLKSAYDFIKSAFAIRVGVLSSQDAEIISQRNNLSFSELIQPFCTLTNEAHIQGNASQSYRAYNMQIQVSDIRQRSLSTDTSTIKELVSDMVLKSGLNESIQNIQVQCGQRTLSVNRSCPWMDTYRDLLLRFGPTQDHEFLSHHIACMLVVSSLHPNPMQEFANLSQLQNYIQHRDKDDNTCKWMTPNTLKFFVLLHDTEQGNDEKAKSVFASLQATYGSKVCSLLRINSRYATKFEIEPNLPDPWYQFMNFTASSHQANSDTSNKSFENSQNGNDAGNKEWLEELDQSSKLTSNKGFGCCLTLADHDQLQIFMQDFIVHALIPHMDKTIKNINEQISAKKALHKSLFRATRTFFSSNKSSQASSTAYAGYNPEGNEMFVRKIADLFFLSQMYDQAFTHYYNARKDYTNEQAWLYVAGASEMAAVSNFMQQNSQKSYPAHYMESAITTYTDVCKNEYLALRCTLLHVECLQLLGMFNEAAFFLIKIATETDDLRSALLLEQAAHCYLKMKEPQPRKFAFHLILAGHRFTKCSQRMHALRCYRLALQVYLQQGWTLAEDHINFTMARQSFNLKKLDVACDSFRNLLKKESCQTTSQQAAFFHEFIHIFQQCQQAEHCSEKFALLNMPKLVSSETSIALEYDGVSEPLTENLVSKISRLEDVILASESLMPNSLVGPIKCFSRLTENSCNPCTAVGENIRLDIVCKNYLDIPIFMSNLSIQWKYKSIATGEYVSSENFDDFVRCSTVPEVHMQEQESRLISFSVQPQKCGKLIASGVVYNVGLSFKQEGESSDLSYSVTDYQPFDIVGRRQNGTKDEKCEVIYQKDQRLNLKVLPVLPKLSAKFVDVPTSMKCNEVIKTSLVLNNCGNLPLDVIKIASEDDIQISLASKDDQRYSLPNTRCDASADQEVKTVLPNWLSQPLLPGENLAMDVWLKAPEVSGKHEADVLFYYKSNSLRETPNARAFLNKHTINCEDAVYIHPSLVNDWNQDAFMISLLVKNIASDESFVLFVDDVSCPNSLYDVELISEKCATGLHTKNHLTMYLKLTRLKAPVVTDQSQTKDKYHFASDNRDKSTQIIVHWMGKIEDSKDYMVGQHCLNLDQLFESTSMFSPLSKPVLVVSEELVSLQSLHQLVRWSLQYKASVTHSFDSQKLCRVKLALIMCNLSNMQLFVNINLPNSGTNSISKTQNQASFTWLGMTQVKKVLSPYGSSSINLTACFSQRGIYNISSVSVTAIPESLRSTTPQLPQKPPCGYFISIE